MIGLLASLRVYSGDFQSSCKTSHRQKCTQHFEDYPLDDLKMPIPFENAAEFNHINISNVDRQTIRYWCKTLSQG
ncbi:MAG: hypothetical protein ACPGYY_01390 [Bacteroidia bacterium]